VIGARLFGALLMSGGFIGAGKLGDARVNYWKRPPPLQWHDPRKVEAAEAKREMRRAKVRKAVAAGGYASKGYRTKDAA